MWLPNANTASNAGTKPSGNSLVAVAIDKDKGSQQALKWTIDNLLLKGQTVILIHVLNSRSAAASSHSSPAGIAFNGDAPAHRKQLADKQTKELFLTFHCFCTRKDVKCLDVVLEDTDIAKGVLEYVSYAAIENLVLGSPSRRGFIRKFKMTDVPSQVSKGAPDFCTIYAISTKGKISSVRNSSRPAPFTSPLHSQIERQAAQDNASARSSYQHSRSRHTFSIKDRTPRKQWSSQSDGEFIRSPFGPAGRGYNNNNTGRLSQQGDFSDSSDSDISFVSSSRPSTSDRTSVSMVYDIDYSSSRPSTSSEYSFGSVRQGGVLLKFPVDGTAYLVPEFSSASIESGRSSTSSTTSYIALDEVEGEMRRLKLELKQTMDLYSTACKEALTAKEKAKELHHWRLKEERRLEEARKSEEAALAIAEKEKAKCRAAMESAEAARRIADLESKKRLSAERKALMDRDNKLMGQDNIFQTAAGIKYRRYKIEDIEEATELFTESRKIGEGGYGPVYHCYLDHTPVAVKVLRSDAAQGRQQFQQEVEVLSCMRHPNMVLLLGACPEYGCLVYEYMANGSLDDRIFRKGNSPPLSWQLRFRIAMEVATGLLFLHQTKPEPWVHRDLKPANILLDHNCVSKISDVGLARLVPPSVADDVTQYLVTSAAGTFCFIDPEYQQTGMLGIKSDIYSFGVLLLQLITAKPAMGLSHHVGRSIDKGTFATEMLDPILNDWPVDEALTLAKLALQCAELRRKDRPDLGKVVLPELQRLRRFADQHQQPHHLMLLYGSTPLTSAEPSPNHSFASSTFSHSAQDVMSDSDLHTHSRNSSPTSHSSCASLPD